MNWEAVNQLSGMLVVLACIVTAIVILAYLHLLHRHRQAKRCIRDLRTRNNRMALTLGNHGLTIP